ncbi:vomeronasal type-2 receptor 116-like [Gastrophryne carolinensis]
MEVLENYQYFKNGDIIIGGIISVNRDLLDYYASSYLKSLVCHGPKPSDYKDILSIQHVIESLNNNSDILPNITLGYHVYDPCAAEIKTVSHGATEPLLSDRASYPFFFRNIHSVHLHFSAITKILKHFSWNWVGIINSGDDTGKQESDLLATYLRKEGICVELTLKLSFSPDEDTIKRIRADIENASSNVFVLCGTVNLLMVNALHFFNYEFRRRTFLIPPSLMKQLDMIEYLSYVSSTFTNSLGILPDISSGNSTNTDFLFSDSYKRDWKAFLQQIQLSTFPKDVLLEDIWMVVQDCLLPHRMKNSSLTMFRNVNLPNCTGKENVKELTFYLDSSFYSPISKAIGTLTEALSIMHSYLTQRSPENGLKGLEYRHKLHHYMGLLHDNIGEERQKRFNENGEMNIDYLIANCVLDLQIPKVASMNDLSNQQVLLIICKCLIWKLLAIFCMRQSLIAILYLYSWSNIWMEAPRSQCSENCLPGTRKIQNDSIHSCCYDCVPCSEGEISSITDSENCIKCSDNEWPNDEKTQCIPKVEEYLSYSDGLAIGLSSVSLLFSVITALIIMIFLRHRNTPIVKANNKNLSFILLGAIIMSFFCVFLFIGRPVDETCMLRQALFGIIFSVAVSSVVAKTIMVSLAFKASKPGSKWRYLISVKVSNCIVVLCSSVQMIISIIWLILYPPFQELDTHSYNTKIIVQCNEGSIVCFYLMQGYMGFLASVSFVIAYVSRLLPNSFNEAKYITFSMLMFCSVWTAMIPAYMSTNGKYMVAVEIFAILASNAGLLGCIFFPKCYIIVFQPTMNTKSFILSH